MVAFGRQNGFARGTPVDSDNPVRVMQQSRNRALGGGSLRYPAEHGRFCTVLNFVTYNRTNPKKLAHRMQQADIVLPLPLNLREYYAITYNDVAFDKLGGAAEAVGGIVDQYLAGGGVDLNAIGSTVTDFAQAMSRNLAGYISDDLSGLIDRFTGNIVNPHVTAVFRGVALRDHNLSFRFTPQSAQESNAVRSIINYIRERMHPEKKNEFLLNFPDEVYVSFLADGKEFLYPIFKCVVTGVDSNMNSDGTNAFFRGTDEPVVIDLSISLKEVESLTRQDFTGGVDANNAETPTDGDGGSSNGQDA